MNLPWHLYLPIAGNSVNIRWFSEWAALSGFYRAFLV